MRQKNREIVTCDSQNSVAQSAAKIFLTLADHGVCKNVFFSIALSGGSTPKILDTLLADEISPFRTRIPCGKIHFFRGDECQVPADHRDSNFRMVNDSVLSKLPIEQNTVHSVKPKRVKRKH